MIRVRRRSCFPALTLLLCTGGCGVAGIGGFDRYDGRWVANLRPREGCGTARIAVDVDGHRVSGGVETADSVLVVKGRVDEHGVADVTVDGKSAVLRFAGENFQTVLPDDPCHREAVGNRGG